MEKDGVVGGRQGEDDEDEGTLSKVARRIMAWGNLVEEGILTTTKVWRRCKRDDMAFLVRGCDAMASFVMMLQASQKLADVVEEKLKTNPALTTGSM